MGAKRCVRRRVKIFPSQLIKEMGRQFFKDVKSPFLGKRRTRISFHEIGKIPSLKA
ncbi:hypothetical protein BX666DRAFT_2016283 [Dichotomocladium elegans]|nr:hypothetical protein BX666DRAFT_2016283 [Dichotomocladium elegans]